MNLNQGAESSVCYLIARSIMERSLWMEERRDADRGIPELHRIVRSPRYPLPRGIHGPTPRNVFVKRSERKRTAWIGIR